MTRQDPTENSIISGNTPNGKEPTEDSKMAHLDRFQRALWLPSLMHNKSHLVMRTTFFRCLCSFQSLSDFHSIASNPRGIDCNDTMLPKKRTEVVLSSPNVSGHTVSLVSRVRLACKTLGVNCSSCRAATALKLTYSCPS